MKKRLSEMKVNQCGRIVSIDNRIKYTVSVMGVRVNKHIRVVAVEPAKGPIVVQTSETSGETTSIAYNLAKDIYVEVFEE